MEKKKKTYVFNQHTLSTLSKLKDMTKKSETQIITEALDLYEEYLRKERELDNGLDLLLEKIANLSYKLGKCEEKLAQYKSGKED